MGRWLKWLMVLALLGLAGVAVYVRVLPIDAAAWHVPQALSGKGHLTGANRHAWRGDQTGEGRAEMARFDAIIRDTPRTQVIAGSVQEGRVTYVTRSRWWGFPDFTTLERNVPLTQDGTRGISVHSRAQFGLSDLGVNQRRLRDWLLAYRAGG